MNLFAISGSLRPQSYNTALLRALARIAPDSIKVDVYDSLKSIPAFDPSLSENGTPEAVTDLRSRIGASKGVIICTPEYAHGVPGVLKNALDWLVDAPELVLKPVAVMSVSTSGLGGVRSTGPLITTLVAMNCNVVIEASLNIPFAKSRFDNNGALVDDLSKKKAELALLAMKRAVDALESVNG